MRKEELIIKQKKLWPFYEKVQEKTKKGTSLSIKNPPFKTMQVMCKEEEYTSRKMQNILRSHPRY